MQSTHPSATPTTTTTTTTTTTHDTAVFPSTCSLASHTEPPDRFSLGPLQAALSESVDLSATAPAPSRDSVDVWPRRAAPHAPAVAFAASFQSVHRRHLATTARRRAARRPGAARTARPPGMHASTTYTRARPRSTPASSSGARATTPPVSPPPTVRGTVRYTLQTAGTRQIVNSSTRAHTLSGSQPGFPSRLPAPSTAPATPAASGGNAFLCLSIEQFQAHCVQISPPMANSVMQNGVFRRLQYASTHVTILSVPILFSLRHARVQPFYNKVKVGFPYHENVHHNYRVCHALAAIEQEILHAYVLATGGCEQKPRQGNVFAQLRTGSVKLVTGSSSGGGTASVAMTGHHVHSPTLPLLLKISGVWETPDAIGLTFQFLRVHQTTSVASL